MFVAVHCTMWGPWIANVYVVAPTDPTLAALPLRPQLMQMLSPQEQQMIHMMPAPQRASAIVQLVQQKRARQAGGGMPGFVPNGGGGGAAAGNRQPQAAPAAAGAAQGMYANLGGMRQGAPQQQPGGLQLPGMLGQQQQAQPSINPFTGGGQQQQYRYS